ncbi:Eukaryotic translation initiation factor 4B [Oleoguttula sp. CCFEE 5521]
MAPKKKAEKMALGDFLQNQTLGSWADEMDSQPLPSASSKYSARDREGGDRSFSQPTWERSGSNMGARGGDSGYGGGGDRPQYAVREELPLPDKPPYTVHLGNLAFDVTQTDVEGFLAGCDVTSVRLIEDKVDRKPKGFGYVEFGTVEGLKKALTLSETSFMGRNVRISVAEPSKERAESTRDFSDWSRKGPLPDLATQGRQPSRGFSRGNFDERSDAGSDRDGGRRPAFFQDDGKVRDFSNWERKGPLSPAAGAAPPARDGAGPREYGAPQERRSSPAWGEGTGRSEAGSRPPRREFQEGRPPADRAPTAAEQDSQWRSKMRPDAPSPAATPEASAPTSPVVKAPTERPRIQLAKRTVSSSAPNSAGAASDSKASPFGAAKPIDTAQRDREVAEKREIAIREKKEADDKAREEKVAKEAAARQARAERADRGQTQQDDKVTSPTTEAAPGAPRRASKPTNAPPAKNPWTKQQNGDSDAPREQQRPSFSLLKHDDENGDDEDGVSDMPDASANGTITGDKETKPQDVVKVVSAGDTAEGAEPTAEAMEEDGWSTVSAKPKNVPKNTARRGGARALAS